MSIIVPADASRSLQAALVELDRRIHDLEKRRVEGQAVVTEQPVRRRSVSWNPQFDVVRGGSAHGMGALSDPGYITGRVIYPTSDGDWAPLLDGAIESGDPAAGGRSAAQKVVEVHGSLAVTSAIQGENVRARNAQITNTLSMDGRIRLNNTTWEDLRFPAQGINPVGLPSPPTLDSTAPFGGTLLFSASATNVVAGVAQMPHTWKIGTSVHPHIHWCPTNTNTGDVAWRFSYAIADINGTFSGSYTTAGILVDTADGTTNKHQYHDFGDIDMSSITGVSSIICWQLERVGGDGSDTYTGTARLLELDFHYEVDSLGSDDEYVKG